MRPSTADGASPRRSCPSTKWMADRAGSELPPRSQGRSSHRCGRPTSRKGSANAQTLNVCSIAADAGASRAQDAAVLRYLLDLPMLHERDRVGRCPHPAAVPTFAQTGEGARSAVRGRKRRTAVGGSGTSTAVPTSGPAERRMTGAPWLDSHDQSLRRWPVLLRRRIPGAVMPGWFSRPGADCSPAARTESR